MLPAFAKVSQLIKTVGRVARWRILGQTYDLQPIECLTAGNNTECIEQAESHLIENCFFSQPMKSAHIPISPHEYEKIRALLI